MGMLFPVDLFGPCLLMNWPVKQKKLNEVSSLISSRPDGVPLRPHPWQRPQKIMTSTAMKMMTNCHFPCPNVDATGRALDSQPAYGKLINAELMLPQNGEYQPVTVIGRTVGPNAGRPEGNYDEVPLMNTMTYDVRFPDGDVKEYSANVISENLLNQVGDKGFSMTKIQCMHH
jgi:hypothetical protein